VLDIINTSVDTKALYSLRKIKHRFLYKEITIKALVHLPKLSEHIFYLILHSSDIFIVSYIYYFIILMFYVIFLEYCEVLGNNILLLYPTFKIILVISTLYCIKKGTA